MCGKLLKRKPVAARLGHHPRWLDHAPIPWRDTRLPGAKRADPRWCEDDVEAYIEARRVLPGHASHIE